MINKEIQKIIMRAEAELDMIKDKARETDMLAKENLELRSRISKAREYIEENIEGNYFKRYDDDIYKACNDLKEILKGEDNEL